MWGLGMIGKLQPEESHATDAKPQAEAGECWDDVTHVPLDPVTVRKARKVAIEGIRETWGIRERTGIRMLGKKRENTHWNPLD